MQSLRESRQAKYSRLVHEYNRLLERQVSNYRKIQLARSAGLQTTIELFEQKAEETWRSINKLSKKIKRIKRKIKEKN